MEPATPARSRTFSGAFRAASSCRSARSIDLYQVADNRRVINWRGNNDQTRRRCARAVRCVLSTEYAVRPTSAAEQFGDSSSPRMWLGTSTGRWHLVSNTRLRAAVRKCSSRKMRMVNGRCEPRATCRRLWRGATCGPATCGHSRHAALIGARRLSKRDGTSLRD